LPSLCDDPICTRPEALAIIVCAIIICTQGTPSTERLPEYLLRIGCAVQAASDFARNKTMAEQRRFLPVYGCRDELLQVIRENQVVVVVGETGSGKTTQVMHRHSASPCP